MTVKDQVLETMDHLPVSQQKEILRFAKQLESKTRHAQKSTKKVTKPEKRRKSRIVMDKELGLPVLTAGPGAPIVTHERIRELLADFP